MLFLIGVADSVILRVPEHPGAILNRTDSIQNETHGNLTVQRIFDFLVLVDDEARQGALRFAEKEGGPFLREEGGKRIPLLVELPELLSAAEHVVEDKDTEEDLRLLLVPGSSLGGARPKASVIEDGQLAIAKAMCLNRRDYAV
jgi:serine/threonine-protein kinase HipA